jgi:hypothetical protein
MIKNNAMNDRERRMSDYSRLLKNNTVWFASNLAMEAWGEKMVEAGILKRVWEIVPSLRRPTRKDIKSNSSWSCLFIPVDWELCDLVDFFKNDPCVKGFIDE